MKQLNNQEPSTSQYQLFPLLMLALSFRCVNDKNQHFHFTVNFIISIFLPVENAQTTAPVRVSSSFDLTEQHATESPTSTDGWGEVENGIHDEDETEKDGWDELEPLDEPKPSPALANIQAAQKRPVSQPVSQTKPPSNANSFSFSRPWLYYI